MRPLLRVLSLFILFGCVRDSFSYVVNRDFSSHGGRLRRSPDLIYQSRGNFFIPSLAGRSDGGEEDNGEFKTNAISYDRKPTFLSLRSLSRDKQSLVGFGPVKATTTTTTTTEATTSVEPTEIPVIEGKDVPVIEGKSDISFIPANNNVPFIRQVPPPSFKNTGAHVQTAPAVFGGPSNTDDGFVNPAAVVQPAAQPGQQPDALSNSPASLANNNVDASGFIPAHPAGTPAGQMASIAGRQDFGGQPDGMNGFGGNSAGFPQMGGGGQFPGGQVPMQGQMPMQDPSQFGGMPQQGMMGQGQNFFPGADTMNPQLSGGMPGGPGGADQFTSQQAPQFGTQNNIFQQMPLPNNPGQFDQFNQGMGGGGMPGQFPQVGGDASNLAPLDPSLQPQQPPPGSQFDPSQQMQGAQFQPQFQQQFPQQFGQGGPQQFGQADPQQFDQAGSQQFAQVAPQQFGQPGPAQPGGGQFMPPEVSRQFNPNAASDGMFIPVPGQNNAQSQDINQLNMVPASQPQPEPEQSKTEEVTTSAPEPDTTATESPKPEAAQDDSNAAVPSDSNANQENPGEAQQRAFFDPAPSNPGAQLAQAQQLQQPQQQPGIPLQGRALDAYGASDQQLQQPQQQPGVPMQASARDAYGASDQGGYAGGMAGPQGYSGGQTNYVGGGGYAGGGGYGGGGGGYGGGRGGAGGSRYSPFLGGIGGGTGFGYPSGGAPYPYGAYGGFGYGYRPYYLGYNYDLAPYGIPQPTDFLLYGKNTLHPEKTYYLKGATDSAASGGTLGK